MKTRILGFVALAAVVAGTLVSLFVVPPDVNQGDAQRIMYPHVASAWLAYLSGGVTALAGIGWLWKRDLRFDAVAVAGAEIGAVFTAFAIWGGMMWGKPVWGTFWQWEDPRLTTTALLLALYVGYLLLRRLSDDPERRATRAAVVGLVAAADIPIVHFSVDWWRSLHQGATFGSPDKLLHPAAPLVFVLTLLGMLGAFTLAWGWLMIRRYQLARTELHIEERIRIGRLTAARLRAQAVPSSGTDGASAAVPPGAGSAGSAGTAGTGEVLP
jgi:heme exporter protein C